MSVREPLHHRAYARERKAPPTRRRDWQTAVGSTTALIKAHFNQACGQLVRSLHELEYYEGIARRTEAVNPAGLADEFTAWVRIG